MDVKKEEQLIFTKMKRGHVKLIETKQHYSRGERKGKRKKEERKEGIKHVDIFSKKNLRASHACPLD